MRFLISYYLTITYVIVNLRFVAATLDPQLSMTSNSRHKAEICKNYSSYTPRRQFASKHRTNTFINGTIRRRHRPYKNCGGRRVRRDGLQQVHFESRETTSHHFSSDFKHASP